VSSGAIVKAENGVRKGKVAEHWANTVKVLQKSTVTLYWAVYSRGSQTFIACASLKRFHELHAPLHPNKFNEKI
jgi:hypothetical protein